MDALTIAGVVAIVVAAGVFVIVVSALVVSGRISRSRGE